MQLTLVHPTRRKFVTGFTGAVALGTLGLVAPVVHAATINAGSADNTFSVTIDSQQKADNLLATSGPDALADSFSHVRGKYTSKYGGFLAPTPAGTDGTVVYHFQADPGATITNATVTSSMYAASHDGGGSVTGLYSTDGTNYTEFAAISVAGGTGTTVVNDDPVDLGTTAGFTGASDLYLKYILTRGDADNGHGAYTDLFRNRVGDIYPGGPFKVDLNVAPEPASLALLGLGGLAIVGRRRRRA